VLSVDDIIWSQRLQLWMLVISGVSTNRATACSTSKCRA
jgi:hypothetical protein